MFATKIGMSLLAASSILLSSLSFAMDLNINNQTKYTLSFKVNNVCSSKFGQMVPYSVKIVSEDVFKQACKEDTEPCQVDVFDQANCEGKEVATVRYYLEKKFVDLESCGNHQLSISVSGFNFLSFVEPTP